MRKFRSIMSKLLAIFGICCLLYPFVSTWYNNHKNTQEFDVYQKRVTMKEDWSDELYKCQQFNKKLVDMPGRFNMKGDMLKEYNKLLNVDGVMAYIEIPKINVIQPVYHGTGIASLSYGVGHFIGSSLPIGGTSTHSVLSGHTGMASQLMFTNLVDLEIGDKFYVTCLNQKLTYEVDQIETVLPMDTSLLEIYEGRDYCTLITCVPLGVNSHRLLVRGHCIGYSKEDAEEEILKTKRVVTTLDKINWFLVAAALLIIGYLVYASIVGYKLHKQKKERYNTFDLKIEGDNLIITPKKKKETQNNSKNQPKKKKSGKRSKGKKDNTS